VFTPVPDNQAGCVQEFNCNWFDCTALGLDAATCQAWCANSSLSANVCLDCSSGTCVEVPGNLNQAQCLTGMLLLFLVLSLLSILGFILVVYSSFYSCRLFFLLFLSFILASYSCYFI
jgi:hypothetical protein